MLIRLAAVLLLLPLCPFLPAAAQGTEYLPGEVLVMLRHGAHARDLERDLKSVDGLPTGLQVVREVSAPMRIWLLAFDDTAHAQERMLRAVQAHPAVQLAQNNHVIHERIVPNDPQFGSQWHHVNGNDADIDSDLAWDITTGGTTATGDEIVVCIIEGANLNHPDLNPNAWVNTGEIPGNGIDDDGNGYVDDYQGWNPGQGNDNVYSGSHGTQVAGMIGAKGNNGLGVVGANWDVKMMVVTIGSLNEANVMTSYTYPLIMRRRYNDSNGAEGAFVVATNASWGIDNANPANYPLWCAFYDTLGTAGVINCGATANNNVNVDVNGDMPTGCSSDFMIGVTATNSSDNRTFSAYGPTTIDVAAPGASVFTTSGTSGYGSTSGTSFASPLTAGVIALLYSAPCPDLMALVQSDPQAGAMLVRQALLNGVDQVGNLPGTIITGGRINANNSLQLLLQDCGLALCLTPGGLQAEEVAPTTTGLSWNGPVDGTFDLRYRVQGEVTWSNVNDITGTSYVLDGLAPCGSYEYQVRRVCDVDEESAWSNSREWSLPGCCAPVTVVIVTDRWGAETTWNISAGGTTYASGGPYQTAGSNGAYPQPSVDLCLPAGCYDLTVNDSYGDGMCCAYGNGFIEVQDGDGGVLASANSFGSVSVQNFCVTLPDVRLAARVILEGPYEAGTGLMRDDLRTLPGFPLTEPYTNEGWSIALGEGGETIGAAVLSVTGPNAIVDWLRVELRDPDVPGTIVAVRYGLLQRDGDVVDTDGTSPLLFQVPADRYRVAVRHRNHLGCMTADEVIFGGTVEDLDLTDPTVAMFGTEPLRNLSGVRLLWAGNAQANDAVRYTGAGNDRDLLLETIGGSSPTSTAAGYLPADINLDGTVKYTGSGNDRDKILETIGGSVPTAVRMEQLP